MLQYWAGHHHRPQGRLPRRPRHCLSPLRIRNNMRRSLDHVLALMELGRHGDFIQISSLRKNYKCHRKSELVRLGLRATSEVRKREAWGSMAHSRLKSPAEVAASVAAAVASAEGWC